MRPHESDHDGAGEEGGEKPLEKLLGSLTLGVIFRHFLSGAVFIAAFLYSQGNLRTMEGLVQLERVMHFDGRWS